MSEISAPLPFDGRLRRVRARVGAFATDALLVGYVAWCVDFLARPDGFLTARPWGYLLATLVAVLWQTTGQSLGQLAWGVRIEQPAGSEAAPPHRAFRGVLAALQVLLALVPAAMGVLRAQAGRDPGLHVVLAILMTIVLLVAGLFDGRGRGLVDRFAGTETAKRPTRQALARRPWWQRPNPWIVVGILLLTFAVGFAVTQVDLVELATGAGNTGHLWNRLVQPDWSIAGKVAGRMVETVFLALMASVLALPFAFVLSFLGARNIMTGTTLGNVVYTLARVVMNVVRSVEPLVWAIIFLVWVGGGPFAGMLALFVHSVAALGKLYSEAIESIDPGPVEAISATGARPLQVLRYGVVPQVVPPFLSFTVYRWDINVRMATILGLVGGGGIGDLLITYQQLGAWSKVGTIIVFITLVVWAMDWLSSKARERLT